MIHCMPYKDPEAKRAYARKYYAANRESHIARVGARNKEYREQVRQFIQQAKSGPCSDCGLQWPYYVMQLDHIGDDKEFTVSDAPRQLFSLKRIAAEIAKCEPVCANCHAIRTYRRKTPE